MPPVLNFEEDLREQMLAEMNSAGYSVNSRESFREVAYKFFNTQRRSIFPSSRKVHTSMEFSCPTDLKPSLNGLIQDLENGINVNGRLSKSLLDANYSDYLLMDWGIHHFHLGTGVDANGFTSRSGPLLFAIVRADNAYLINVLPHGSWSNDSLIRIVHNNWPDVIEAYRLHGVLGLSKQVTETDRSKLRSAQINTFVEIEHGVVYGQLGGGYTLAGTSLIVETQIQRFRETIKDLEKYVSENILYLRHAILNNGHQISGDGDFHLYVDDRGFHAVERSTMCGIFLCAHGV